MKDFNYKEVFRLLNEMEACVNRVKALRAQFETNLS